MLCFGRVCIDEVFLRFGRKSYIPLEIHLYHICSNIYHNKYSHDLRLCFYSEINDV